MTIDPKDSKHIIADEGKVFQRIADEMIYGEEIYLGYSYYIGGVLLTTPHEDKYEDFQEIDKPIEEEEVEEEPLFPMTDDTEE